VSFDPFLYVALAAGYVVGRVVKVRGPWVPRATLVTVAVLVALLGATLDSVPLGSLLVAIPIAFAFVAGILALTALLAVLFARSIPPARGTIPPASSGRRFAVSLGMLAALVFGVAIGRVVSIPSSSWIPWVLYVLLALVGFGIVLTRHGLRELWIPVTAAVVGALAIAGLFVGLGVLNAPGAIATALGFGFYSLAGPLVVARLGAALGLVAFLTNFLREQLTMLLAPVLGPRLRGPGLAAIGGATSMDTTLFFITRYGDPDAASLALATGFVLTLTASLALPAVLAFPW
jgi:uncharacterized membrane protein YbjE (DUF340 family)